MSLDQLWYSLDEAADRYGVSRRAVERWARDGRIVITTLAGTTRRISAASLLAFEQANRAVTLPPVLTPDDADPSGNTGGDTKGKRVRPSTKPRQPR